jgi:hypothetical protein
MVGFPESVGSQIRHLVPVGCQPPRARGSAVIALCLRTAHPDGAAHRRPISAPVVRSSAHSRMSRDCLMTMRAARLNS